MRAVVLVMLALAAASCARESVLADPPPACITPDRLSVVGHGWHTGLVVKRADLVELIPALAADLPASQHVEIGWGDEAYYQAERGTVALALGALFNSKSSALQVVSFSGSPREHFPGSETIELCADERAYRAVVAFVADSFMRDADGRVVRLGRSQYGNGWFYRAQGAFSARNTCNTWVAKALAHANFPISTSVVRAEELLVALRALPR